MNRLSDPFRDLTAFERRLWASSMAAVILSYVLAGGGDPLSLTASLIGVTALIFLARGYVIGQVLIVVFSLFYGLISWRVRYYGEMITYLGMTTPTAIAAVVSWLRHPYQGTREVEVSRLSRGQKVFLAVSTALVTALFGWILRAMGTASLLPSTVSVTTSYLASALTYFRSSWYALGYAANDVVLVVLWVLAAMEDPTCLAMVVCFLVFLVNDLYGFLSWRKMQRRQEDQSSSMS